MFLLAILIFSSYKLLLDFSLSLHALWENKQPKTSL